MKYDVLEFMWKLLQFAWWTFWSICMIIMITMSFNWATAIMAGQPTTPTQFAYVFCVAINVAAVVTKINKEKKDTRT